VEDVKYQVATFSVQDAPQVIATVQFDILAGKGIPSDVADYKYTSDNGDNYAALGGITYLDKFDNKLTKASDLSKASGWNGTYAMEVELVSGTTKLELTQGLGGPFTINAAKTKATLGTADATVNLPLTLDGLKVSLKDGVTATTSGKVTVTLYQKVSGKMITVGDFTKTVTVVAAEKNSDMDGFQINVVAGYDYNDDEVLTSDVYLGEYNSTTGEWKTAPQSVMVYAVGLVGSTEQRILSDYTITDEAGLLNETDIPGIYELQADSTFYAGTARTDTLTLTLEGEDEPATTATVNFLADEPVATTLDAPKQGYFGIHENEFIEDETLESLTVTNGTIKDYLVARDQYGAEYTDSNPEVILNYVYDEDGKQVLPADGANYENKYPREGKTFELVNGYSANRIHYGYELDLSIKWGAIEAPVTMVVDKYTPVWGLSKDSMNVTKACTGSEQTFNTADLVAAMQADDIVLCDQYGATKSLKYVSGGTEGNIRCGGITIAPTTPVTVVRGTPSYLRIPASATEATTQTAKYTLNIRPSESGAWTDSVTFDLGITVTPQPTPQP
jgi:hypothetical protein